MSEDLAYLYGLFSVQSDILSSWAFIIFYSSGVLIGDMGLYLIGVFIRKNADSLIGQGFKKVFKPRIADANNDFTFGHFEEFLVFTRFIPGTRIPTYVYSGMIGYSASRFIAILGIATLLYSGLGVMLVILFESIDIQNMGILMEFAKILLIAGATIGLFKLALLIRGLKKKFSQVARPLWILIYRWIRPEFWPGTILYLPFVPYFLALFVRYRGLSSALAANPAIKMSGFIGENKSEIDLLLKSFLPGKRLALQKLDSFNFESALLTMEKCQLTYPVTVKPDSGMRGTGVAFVENDEELKHYLENATSDLVIQEYCSHQNEWGVFYYRFPGQEQGNIFSITRKDFPEVTGDGKSTLFELVMRNACLSERFDLIFKDGKQNPAEILASGKTRRLVERGSHSKGCVFRDGRQWVHSPVVGALKNDLDLLDDFYIGRADVRFENIDELAKGNYKIIELNGAGAESTNFYDPDLSLIALYRIMIGQWELIYKIGDYNRTIGRSHWNLFDLFKSILKYRKEKS